MCGIAGVISVRPDEVSVGRIRKMTDVITHRGPDGDGQWISEDGRVGFGHRRLSIIDLSKHAGQPMHYLDRYTITFNGEIYNYIELKESLLKQGCHFKTSSDTEVLMALYDRYKEQCLKFLDGMFSFAIYDNKEKKVFCARDRFGEKPFHYCFQQGISFVFGSEMKELWAAGIPKETNNGMLYNYLRYGFLQNPANNAETFYTNIQRLEQSHYLLIDTEKLTFKKVKYWDLDLTLISDLSINDAAEKFRELFTMSVSRRLRSDVPIGSSLSGGLDSSAVVCAIDALNPDKQIHQKTFSARFPGFQKDESYFQQLVIDQAQTDAFYTYPDADRMLSELNKVFWHQEEPFGSASIIAQYEVFKLAKQNDVTVLLDGQGADEMLAGYPAYFSNYFMELENNKKEFDHQFAAYTQLHPLNKMDLLQKRDLKFYLREQLPVVFDKMRAVKNLMIEDRGGLNKDFYHEYRKESFFGGENLNTLNKALYASILGGSMQNLLRYADRSSMAHSLEVRLPFLNHELVEFVFSLPATYKLNEGWTKYVMRKAFTNLLPGEITWRVDKVGYEPPQKKWMEQDAVQIEIGEIKQELVKNKILDPKEVGKKVVSVNHNGLNDWSCWMAGKLIKS